MSSTFTVRSHRGPYEVSFVADALAVAHQTLPESAYLIVDERLTALYTDQLQPLLSSRRHLLLPATEGAKSLERFPEYVSVMTERGIRRGQPLLAIGGGVIQDITAFLASTLLRGLDWYFVPTTLLAQTDSCIGSKSSINCGGAKNILGTFTPPQRIWIDVGFRRTLSPLDIHSGIGEMLKAHAIAGPDLFDALAADFGRLLSDDACMSHYVMESLRIKVPFIEQDEFDAGIRNIFNYGHSFGHAIEAALEFTIPHGLAVTVGMDIANYVAWRLGMGSQLVFERMHPVLRTNYEIFPCPPIPMEAFLRGLGRDKKNAGQDKLGLILPDSEGRLHRIQMPKNAEFAAACNSFFRDHLAGTA